MKVQCDVCENAEAILMCCADEAVLCNECDGRIHTANKLASKHQRLSLLYPDTSEQRTSCDICQQKVGFFFCLEDRALLCRSCDFSIHSSNALTAKHKRFLVPGIRVSLEAALHTPDGKESVDRCALSQIHSSPNKPSALSSPEGAITNTSSSSGLAKMGASIARQSSQLSQPSLPSNLWNHISHPETELSSPEGAITNTSTSSGLAKMGVSKAPQSSQLSQQSFPSNLWNHISHPETDKCGTKQSLQLHQPPRVDNSGQQGEVSGIPISDLSIPVNPFNHQIPVSPNWDTHIDNMTLGSILAAKRGSDDFAKQTSISEYLTESIPGWRMDELLSFTDASSIYTTGCGSSKVEPWNHGHDEWQAPTTEDLMMARGPAEVPSIPSPPTISDVLKSTRGWGPGKLTKSSDLDFFLHCDDVSVVPDVGGDIGGVTSLSMHCLTPPISKRRRFGVNF